MFSKKDIAKIARKVLKRQRGLRDHQMIHPAREWLFGLLVAVGFLAAGTTWSFITFQDLSERNVENVDEVKIKQSGYQPEAIDGALELFKERIERYEALTTSPVTPSEPEEAETEALPTNPTEQEAEDEASTGEELAPAPEPEFDSTESETQPPLPPSEAPEATEEAGTLPTSEESTE